MNDASGRQLWFLPGLALLITLIPLSAQTQETQIADPIPHHMGPSPSGHPSSENFGKSPAQDVFAIEGVDGEVFLWNAKTFEELCTLDDSLYPISRTLTWSIDGRLVAAGYDDRITIWNANTCEIYQSIPSSIVTHLALSPDNHHLAYLCAACPVSIWNMDTQTERHLADSQGRLRVLEYSPTGSLLLAGGSTSTTVWDVASGNVLHEFAFPITAAAFSPDSRLLAVCRLDSTVSIWDMQTGEFTDSFNASFTPMSVQWTSDGRTVLAAFTTAWMVHDDLAYNGAALHGWDVLTGEKTHIFEVTSERLLPLELNDEEILVAYGEGIAWVTNTVTGEEEVWHNIDPDGELQPYTFTAEEIVAFQLSPDETLLAVGTDRGTVLVWDFEEGELLATFHSPRQAVYRVIWLSEGQTLASASGDGFIRLWGISGLSQ